METPGVTWLSGQQLGTSVLMQDRGDAWRNRSLAVTVGGWGSTGTYWAEIRDVANIPCMGQPPTPSKKLRSSEFQVCQSWESNENLNSFSNYCHGLKLLSSFRSCTNQSCSGHKSGCRDSISIPCHPAPWHAVALFLDQVLECSSIFSSLRLSQAGKLKPAVESEKR